MHEIYLLAVLSNASRQQTAQRTRDERRRDEQAFYDLHSGDRRPRFTTFLGRVPAMPIAAVVFAAMAGLGLLWR
jgi:hypothetical protein